MNILLLQFFEKAEFGKIDFFADYSNSLNWPAWIFSAKCFGF